MDFKISKEQLQALRKMSLEELELYENISMETYNTVGQLRVTKMLEATESIMNELCFADENNWYHHGIKTSVLKEYNGIGIFVKEHPPKLKQFINTVDSQARGMAAVSKRWAMYMLVAINQLRDKGVMEVETPAVAFYRFRVPGSRSDADNFSVKILNDCLRDSMFIEDDSLEFLSTYVTGVYDEDNLGTEIFLVPQHKYTKLWENLVSNFDVAII